MGAKAEIRIPVVVDGDEIAKARIAGVKTEMEGLLVVIQRVNVELDAMDEKLNRLRATTPTVVLSNGCPHTPKDRCCKRVIRKDGVNL